MIKKIKKGKRTNKKNIEPIINITKYINNIFFILNFLKIRRHRVNSVKSNNIIRTSHFIIKIS